MEIRRTALVPHTAMDMFRLVRDVEAYPDFLKWCTRAEVHEQTVEEQLATLSVKVSGVAQRFTTRNRFVPGEKLTLSLVDGPFRHLGGEWLFQQLGEDGSKVTLVLDFDFSSSLLSSAFRRGFTHVADHLVSEFCQRADQVYG
ncbi:MAG: type II toxin-antitoxin system RatA family toxin [Xanthomonadales bacterium]|nr:type II toxin-antitoxin system RatA family toxin [Xanthomonadales bacterium]